MKKNHEYLPDCRTSDE